MWTNGDPCLFLTVSDFNNEWDHQKLELSAMEILVRDSVGAVGPIASSWVANQGHQVCAGATRGLLHWPAECNGYCFSTDIHVVCPSLPLDILIAIPLSHNLIPALFLPILLFILQFFTTVHFSSVTQSCPTLCDSMNRSTPGLPVHHQYPEPTQTHVHWVSDAIQPSNPLLFPSPPALNLSQHQGLFQWVSSSHQVAKVLEFQLQHQFLQWTPKTNLL